MKLKIRILSLLLFLFVTGNITFGAGFNGYSKSVIPPDSVIAVFRDSLAADSSEFDSLEFTEDHDSLFAGTTEISVKVVDSLNVIHNAEFLSPFFRRINTGKIVSVYHLGDSHIAGKALPAAFARNLHESFGQGSSTIIAPKIKKRKKSRGRNKSYKSGKKQKQPSLFERRKARQKSTSKRRRADIFNGFPASSLLTDYTGPLSGNLTKPQFETDVQIFPLMPADATVNYASFGVNGKSFKYFSELPMTTSHLRQFKPHLIIISLGVNDLFGKRYDSNYVRTSFTSLLRTIRLSSPEAVILLTFPGDAFVKKRKTNPFLPLMRKQLITLAAENECAWWDPVPVFGGYGYMSVWYKKNMCVADKIHLTKPGYTLFAQKLGEALVKCNQGNN